jgi:hypothetical protein
MRKYASLRRELESLAHGLELAPGQGTPLGNGCYKIRIAIASKGKGKSGGARIITHVAVTETAVYLMTIYDKSEKENLSNTELRTLLADVPSQNSSNSLD